MTTLHAQLIKKGKRTEYVVLPYAEFVEIQEQLQEYADLRCLREAKELEGDAPTIGLEELKKKIGARTSASSGHE